MKRARFSEGQILAFLKEHGVGAKASDLARKYGILEATLYNWKGEYGGMELSEAWRLKALEEDNAKLKKLLLSRCSTLRRFANFFQQCGKVIPRKRGQLPRDKNSLG